MLIDSVTCTKAGYVTEQPPLQQYSFNVARISTVGEQHYLSKITAPITGVYTHAYMHHSRLSGSTLY